MAKGDDWVSVWDANIDWLKSKLDDEHLYCQGCFSATESFKKIDYSNILLHSAIQNKNIWIERKNLTGWH
jgi:hypothetical protein